ncbi:hypothetical protein ElyMa_002055100 [Elysia marginata]|uniref:Uncharacterized protein n=1 Tax=Elysia marginata TaxID=1093978 RepID=A0AAV4F9L2_9GAST|nr:hypothetical protein ElyMa_002055100 [Elysia marginata]
MITVSSANKGKRALAVDQYNAIAQLTPRLNIIGSDLWDVHVQGHSSLPPPISLANVQGPGIAAAAAGDGIRWLLLGRLCWSACTRSSTGCCP